MEFVLLIAISLIPVIIAISLLFYSKTEITNALSVFLVLLSFWQIDIAFLYANDFLTEAVIDPVFRFFRLGPIMIMPIMYYFGYQLVRDHKELRIFKYIYNKYVFYTLLLFSGLVYATNFTNAGIVSYTVIEETVFAPSHLLPLYGELNSLFMINTLLVFTNTITLTSLSIKLKDNFFKSFYSKLAFGAFFIFLNGLVSAFGSLPLYFSSFNSILVAIILFLGFFQMQSQKLSQMNNKLSKQSSLLETIMNINPNYIVVLNKDNKMIKINDSICSLLSIDREQMVGRDFSQLEKQSNLKVETKKLQKIISLNREIHYVQWQFEDLKDHDDEFYTLFFGVDYSEQKQNEMLLLSSEKTKVIGELAASIAHEIRNPLTTVRGFIQLIKERNIDSKYEGIIIDEIDRINEVLKELLLLAKPEASDSESVAEKLNVDVYEKIMNVKLLCEAVANEQNKRIYVTNALQTHTHVAFQKSHFKQVIINTVKNSLEALPSRGCIKIKLDEFEGQIRIRIIDNGKGMSKARLLRIGEPYFTNKEKGTGIGLTICFKLIKDYLGQMKVKSKLGWGTTVTILLPISDSTSTIQEDTIVKVNH